MTPLSTSHVWISSKPRVDDGFILLGYTATQIDQDGGMAAGVWAAREVRFGAARRDRLGPSP
jgi:hypothetical protein